MPSSMPYMYSKHRCTWAAGKWGGVAAWVGFRGVAAWGGAVVWSRGGCDPVPDVRLQVVRVHERGNDVELLAKVGVLIVDLVDAAAQPTYKW